MPIPFSAPRIAARSTLLGCIGILAIAALCACSTDDTASRRTEATMSIPTETAPTSVAPSTTELPPLSATETFDAVPGEQSDTDAIATSTRVAPPVTTRPVGSGSRCLPTEQQSVPGQDAATIAPPAPGVQWWVDRIGGTVCPGLSWAALNVLDATGSSPWQLLIYHNGYFLGTGTRCNLPYQSIVGQNRESVTVAYKYVRGDEPNAAPSGRATVTYRWNGSHVVMDGSLPTALTQGKC